jgi:hypothetical protein
MKLSDVETPTEAANLISILFEMPDEIRERIIMNTDTVEERNNLLIVNCYANYVSQKYRLTSYSELESIFESKNKFKYLKEFFREVDRMSEKYHG